MMACFSLFFTITQPYATPMMCPNPNQVNVCVAWQQVGENWCLSLDVVFTMEIVVELPSENDLVQCDDCFA
jgi:hypothetical protein